MNVTELINKLKDIPGHHEVFSKNEITLEDNPINNLEIKESTSPRGIKYLLLKEEVNNPPMTEKKPDEKAMYYHEEVPETEFYKEKVKKKRGRPRKEEPKIMTNEKTKEFLNKVREAHLKPNKKITIIKHIKVTKEKRTHKCYICQEPVHANTGIHATIPGEPHKKLIHKECRKELKKEGIIKKKRNSRRKMQKDFTGYNKRCLRCKLGKPSTDYTKGNHYCRSCREEQRKNREKKT